MKVEQLKFPLTINWFGVKYEVRKRGHALDWILVQQDGSYGTTFENSVSALRIVNAVNEGDDVEILSMAEGAKEAPLAFTITVDTSPLDRALATAKELEATLLRIKALL